MPSALENVRKISRFSNSSRSARLFAGKLPVSLIENDEPGCARHDPPDAVHRESGSGRVVRRAQKNKMRRVPGDRVDESVHVVLEALRQRNLDHVGSLNPGRLAIDEKARRRRERDASRVQDRKGGILRSSSDPLPTRMPSAGQSKAVAKCRANLRLPRCRVAEKWDFPHTLFELGADRSGRSQRILVLIQFHRCRVRVELVGGERPHAGQDQRCWVVLHRLGRHVSNRIAGGRSVTQVPTYRA